MVNASDEIITVCEEPFGRSVTSARAPRLAVNPIAYWLVNGRVDKSRAVFDAAFADVSRLGFSAVKADVPEGMSPPQYLDWLDSYGLAPSVSLFNSVLDDTIDVGAELDRARRFGAQQAALGLDRTMVSSVLLRARMVTPAVGADYSEARFQTCVHHLGLICEVLRAEGVWPVLHNHIGGVFETGDEVERVLGSIGPDLLGFGPDTGHLRWAGADPAELIARHRSRVGAIHIKDMFMDHLEPHRPQSLTYSAATATKRLWAEPGSGIIDWEAVLEAMPRDYDGDYMIEVDEPSVDDRVESLRVCHSWAVRALSFLSNASPSNEDQHQ